MNELKVFQNSEFGELGILLIDGKEYFPATQCAKIIGHQNPARAVRKYCKGVTKMVTPTEGGTQEINYIPEGDLYRLIVSSKLPAAERFERWVFDEVLPALRKNGSYGNINLEAVITQAVTMAVSETVRQIVPAIVTSMQEQPKQIVRKQIAHRYQYRTPSKISLLPPALKEKVEEMILSGEEKSEKHFRLFSVT